jgi:hypothetical protein
LLIDAGADAGRTTEEGYTYLQEAIRWRCLPICDAIIADMDEAEAERLVNAATVGGDTAMVRVSSNLVACLQGFRHAYALHCIALQHLAARLDSRDAMEWLLGHGANVNLRNADKRTPQEVAQQAGHGQVLDWLKDALKQQRQHRKEVRDAQAELFAAIRSKSRLQALIEAGAPIGLKDRDGNTLLHRACGQSGNADVVQYLLSLSIAGGELNLNTKNHVRIGWHWRSRSACYYLLCPLLQRKWTPLHVAALHGNTQVIEVLLQHVSVAAAVSVILADAYTHTCRERIRVPQWPTQ